MIAWIVVLFLVPTNIAPKTVRIFVIICHVSCQSSPLVVVRYFIYRPRKSFSRPPYFYYIYRPRKSFGDVPKQPTSAKVLVFWSESIQHFRGKRATLQQENVETWYQHKKDTPTPLEEYKNQQSLTSRRA